MTGYSGFRARVLCLGLLVIALTIFAAPAPGQEVRYFYDALNRLVGVVDAQGNGAEYIYDAVGNLLRIRRYTAAVSGGVAILLVRPSQGTVHTPVEIYGRGFSAVPTQNQVAFNGAAATVTAATESSLLTAVPAGASTGPITVTTPLGSATTPDPFTVRGDFVVVPDQADVALGATLAFQARLDGTPTDAVTWRVNGVAGGSMLYGTITPAGLYAAPTTPPPIPMVTVEAVRTADPTWVAPASVRLDQPGGTLIARAVSIGSAVDPAAQAISRAVSLRAWEAPGGEISNAPVSVAPFPQDAPVVSVPVAVTRSPVITGLNPSSAGAGSSVSLALSGVGFTGATALTFEYNGAVDPSLAVSNFTVTGDGAATATLTLASDALPGVRVARIATQGGTTTTSGLGPHTFTVPQPAAPVLTATPSSVAQAGTVTATWSGVPTPTTTDWITIAATGSGDTSYIAWLYDSSCTTSPGATARAAGSCALTVPSTATPGTYELRLFANNGYTRLATSGPFTVTGP